MTTKILIVDDDIDTLQLVGTMLERQGYTIIAANTGEQALKKAKAENPDLIILDVMMPGIDGYEVTRRLRTIPNTAFIPIIMFTAKSQVEDKVEGFDSGADDYLTKPTHPNELMARVKNILERPLAESLSETEIEEPFDPEEKPEPIPNIFGLISAKGGVGTSTLALNLAVSIHQSTKDYVTLAEFRPGQGTIGLSLGYNESPALLNLLRKEANNISVDDVEEQIISHGSGIQMLLASYTPEDMSYSNNIEQQKAIVFTLAMLSKYTLLDLGVGLTDANRALLGYCGKIIILLDQNPVTIIQTKAFIKNLDDLGINEDLIHLVMLNRSRLESAVPVNKVEERLGFPLSGVITPVQELAYQAALKSEPMIMHQPNGITANQINKLSRLLTFKKEPS